MTISALVVGLGSIGQRHARNLRSILGSNLILSALRSQRGGLVITDQLVTSTSDPEADCNGGIFTDLDQALAAEPEIVIICNPTSLHVEVVEAAVRAGAAVFVEKPISNNLRGLTKLADLVVGRGGVVAVGCQLRFHPALISLKALLSDQVLGRLITVNSEQGEYLPSYHPYEDYRHSYAARSDLGGGVVLTQIHEIDYLQWLFGMPSTVFAVGGHISELEIDVEDSASALFAYENDGHHLAVHLHVDFLQQPPIRRCRVVGLKGVIDVDLQKPSLTWTNNDGAVVLTEHYPGFTRSQMYIDEMRHFLAAARKEEKVKVDLPHAIDTTRIALAIRQSLSSGKVEYLQ